MKRSSVIGPLILILLGTLFLLKNMMPELPVIDFLGRAWPAILIAWGALRLAELTWWFFHRRALPSNGLSGGEWFLVVLISVFGSGLYMARNNQSWLNNAKITLGGVELFNDAFEFPLNATVQAPKATKLIIESFRGDAQITGADVTEVRVTGKKSVNAPQQSEADRMDHESPLEVTLEGNSVVVRCNQSRVANSRITDKLEIIVPKNFAIDAKGRYGDFDIRDINGAVEIDSDNAGVRLDNLAGPVKVETRKSDTIHATQLKGSLELRGKGSDLTLESILGTVTVTGAYSGTVEFRDLAKPVRFESPDMQFRAEKIAGEVRSTLRELVGSNVVGPIRISSNRSRDVKLSDYTQALEIEVNHGDVVLKPSALPLAKMSVHTRNGDIDLSLPELAKFDLKSSTSHGDENNEWGDALKVESGKHNSTLMGIVGTQGPALIMTSDRGNFTIRKAGREEREEKAEKPEAPEAPEKPERPEAAPKAPKAPVAPKITKPEVRVE